mmetsp:Transcript_92784/g.258030  ORF Transcript_92784/g.258030 Transcript_92784/m.258030 type:complete len:364 (+) Transcript_92784:361-1452(+)
MGGVLPRLLPGRAHLRGAGGDRVLRLRLLLAVLDLAADIGPRVRALPRLGLVAGPLSPGVRAREEGPRPRVQACGHLRHVLLGGLGPGGVDAGCLLGRLQREGRVLQGRAGELVGVVLRAQAQDRQVGRRRHRLVGEAWLGRVAVRRSPVRERQGGALAADFHPPRSGGHARVRVEAVRRARQVSTSDLGLAERGYEHQLRAGQDRGPPALVHAAGLRPDAGRQRGPPLPPQQAAVPGRAHHAPRRCVGRPRAARERGQGHLRGRGPVVVRVAVERADAPANPSVKASLCWPRSGRAPAAAALRLVVGRPMSRAAAAPGLGGAELGRRARTRAQLRSATVARLPQGNARCRVARLRAERALIL